MADPHEQDPPKIGYMRLWQRLVPDLPPGGYTATLAQELTDGGDEFSPDDVEAHFDVTGPRFSLPGPELHSLFPPVNASGVFTSRLPHVALKRRTLPWERRSDDAQPWMALVVLDDLEGELRHGPIREAFTDSAHTPAGVPDEGTCDALVTTRRVVDAVFPARAELSALAHVRQVNMLDAENLGADEDGWMAVVIANRLPRQTRTYTCYLVSLEGQWDLLPEPGDVASEQRPTVVSVYEDVRTEIHDAAARPHDLELDLDDPKGQVVATLRAGLERQGSLEPLGRTSPQRFEAAETAGWNLGGAVVDAEEATPSGATAEAKRIPRTINFVSPLLFDPGDQGDVELRFPVLAHWSFDNEGGADFQALMSDLDVAMLGTPPSRPSPGESSPPPAPPVLPTGHTEVDHTNRRGEHGVAWYRGAFVPRQVARRPAGRPLWVADQALAVGGDGRLDLSEAAAFEIGRLLAVSDEAFLEALWRWRRRRFAVSRKSQLAQFLDVDPELVHRPGLGRFVEHQLLDEIARVPERLLPRVDLLDHADRLQLTDDVVGRIAAGLGAQPEVVQEALGPGLARATGEVAEPAGVGQSFDEVVDVALAGGLAGLRDTLDRTARDLHDAAEATDRQLGGDLRFGPGREEVRP